MFDRDIVPILQDNDLDYSDNLSAYLLLIVCLQDWIRFIVVVMMLCYVYVLICF